MLHAIAHVLDTNNAITHPSAMSVDAYCKLYFLVDGDTSVQSILTYGDWDIDDLKTAIMNKAHLGHFKTFDIILRRVKIAFFLLTCLCSYTIPLKLNPLRRLSIGFRPQSQIPPVVLKEPTAAVSDFFPRNPAKGHLSHHCTAW